jgi:hypothetical protein
VLVLLLLLQRGCRLLLHVQAAGLSTTCSSRCLQVFLLELLHVAELQLLHLLMLSLAALRAAFARVALAPAALGAALCN